MLALEAKKLLLVSLHHSPGLSERLAPGTIDLKIAERLNVDSFRKKFYLLMKLRKKMINFMTVSGNGSNDPSDFVLGALSHVPNGASIHKDAILYFYCRCEEKKGDVDKAFQTEMDAALKGSSVDIGPSFVLERSKASINKKQGRADAYAAMHEVVGLLTKEHEVSQGLRLDLKKSSASMLALTAAVTLNDTAMIQKILDDNADI